MVIYTHNDAWAEYHKGNFTRAEDIWLKVLEEERNPQTLSTHVMGYCHTLNKLGRFAQSRDLLRREWEKTHNHVFLHNLAATERLAGNLELSLALFKQEELFISHDNDLGFAANLYEQTKALLLLNQLDEALDLGRETLVQVKICGDELLFGCVSRLLGDVYKALNDSESALEYYALAQKKFKKLKSKDAVAELQSLVKEMS